MLIFKLQFKNCLIIFILSFDKKITSEEELQNRNFCVVVVALTTARQIKITFREFKQIQILNLSEDKIPRN